MRSYLSVVICGLCLLPAMQFHEALHFLSLSGCGGAGIFAPVASLSPTTLTFGTEDVETTSQPLPVMVTNSGNATLDIASITASANFGETDNCGLPLAPGASCTINVTFTPGQGGTLNGTLTITDNASDSPQKISLSGTGSSTPGNSCSVKGQQCPPQFPPCCPGLQCVPASSRAFCE